jgi:hypothetical protein
MCIEKVCCAPENGERCSNFTLNANCDHCKKHHEKALELYLKYKEICIVANNKNINVVIKDKNKHIRYLYNCHLWLERAYDARLEHRFFAYVPECYDYGHDKQFIILQQKLNICRTKCAALFELLQVKDEMVVEKEEQEPEVEEEFLNVDLMVEKISQFKEKQKKDDIEFDKTLQANIRQNNKLAQDKLKVVTLCNDLIKKKLQVQDRTYFNQIAIFRIIVEMKSIGYFDMEYKPEACRSCSCGEYMPMQFKLGCSCYLKKDGDSISFLSRTNIETYYFKSICQVILKKSNKVKINSLIRDYMACYNIHGTNMIKKLMTLLWDSAEKRLVLSCENIKLNEKLSESMARLRQRKAVYPVWNRKRKIVPINERWADTLDEVTTFIDRNGKLPPLTSKRPEIRNLCEWLDTQLDHYTDKTGLMQEERICSAFEKFIYKYYDYFPEDTFYFTDETDSEDTE